MGRIAIEGMKFYAHHGYYHDERKLGNNFSVDVYVDTNFSSAGREDDLEKTVDYEKIYAVTKEIMEDRSYLIERVAIMIHKAISKKFNQISYCKVRVSKLNPPIKGEVERTYVEFDSNDLI
ncbi:MAG: dihydroneopterin aldolase [Limisphaerales bacterium]|jgi:dihydroneopterin aldolase